MSEPVKMNKRSKGWYGTARPAPSEDSRRDRQMHPNPMFGRMLDRGPDERLVTWLILRCQRDCTPTFQRRTARRRPDQAAVKLIAETKQQSDDKSGTS